ncbi:MAG: flagellar hook-length control protein FliK [Methylobacter sp.]
MNIEGTNLLSLLPANNTIEGVAQSLPENGAIPEDFANALMGQIGLLSGANGQVELPGQLQSMTMSQTMNNLLKHKGGEEELVALFDKYLSMAYKKNETVDLNKDADLEATLLALTDALKSITPGITTDEVATAQNMSLALTDALKSITPGITSDEQTTAQNMNDVMALNGLFFVKPLPEEAKSNMPGKEDIVSGDFLQKETVLRQSIQDEQGFNLQALENADPAKKILAIEKQASSLGIEQAAPGVTADMITLHRPVDNRTDSPAITRPLTHPGWSKDLGEQIIWMNNKAIPAAEINLNPEHLGPISVRIDVNQDQATIMFTAQHANVKEALEASIPKLREMLATQQLNLINVNISQNSTSDQGRSQSQTFSNTSENREQGIEGVTNTIEKTEHGRVVVSKGLLSLYA